MKFLIQILLLLFVLTGCERKDNIDQSIGIKEYPLKHNLTFSFPRNQAVEETLIEKSIFSGIYEKGEKDLDLPSDVNEDDSKAKKRIKSILLTNFELFFKNSDNKKCLPESKRKNCTPTNKKFIESLKFYVLSKKDNKKYLKLKEEYEEETETFEALNGDDPEIMSIRDDEFVEFDEDPGRYGGIKLAEGNLNHFKRRGNGVKLNLSRLPDIKDYYFNLDKYVIKVIYYATLPEIDTFISGSIEFNIEMTIPLD